MKLKEKLSLKKIFWYLVLLSSFFLLVNIYLVKENRLLDKKIDFAQSYIGD